MIIAYTDGACKGNGQQAASAGGFGVHIQYPNGDVREIWGGEPDTTNNRMELMAAIYALKHTPTDQALQLWTDSSYVKNGISTWIHHWKAKDWRKADGKPVLNIELWQQLDTLSQNRQIDWQWIKGHAGHEGNEAADRLANLGVAESGDHFYPAKNNEMQQSSPTSFIISPTGEQNPEYDGDTSQANSNFWALLPEPVNRGKMERQLIMDTETTGFDDKTGDRIVEIGVIEMVGRRFTGNKLHVYINPEKHMEEEVIRVHGISNEFVSDKPKFADVCQKVYEFMVDSEVIAHNASFDMRFLQMEFEKAGITDFLSRVHVTDTLAMARQMFPGQKNTLDALVNRLAIEQRDRTFHGALLDSEILADVFLKMTSGQISLSIEDEQTQDSDDQGVQFNNLSQYASLLSKSISDHDADAAWRKSVLG